MRTLLLVVALTFVLAAEGAGQTYPPCEPLQVHNVKVTLEDTSGRPFDSASLDVSLVSASGYESGQVLSCGPVQFAVGEENVKTFPVRRGETTVPLLVPADPQKESFRYQFRARGADGESYVSHSWEVNTYTHTIALICDRNAPLRAPEVGGGLGFGVLALGLVLATFFYLGFRRMLFNRRMEVGSAVLWSTIITLFYLVLLSATVFLAYLYPSLLSKAVTTYAGLIFAFLGVYLLGLIFLMLTTRPRAGRS